MKQDKGMLRSGRARLAALGAVALIAGGVMLYRHAEAQAAPTAHPVSFAPMALSPYSGNLGIQIAELDMLLPAVQHASRGFVIHVFSPVGEVNLEIPPAAERVSQGWIYEDYDAIGNLYLYVYETSAGVKQLQVPSSGYPYSIQVLPAIRANGKEAMPTSAGLLINGTLNTSNGSAPPFQYPMSPVSW